MNRKLGTEPKDGRVHQHHELYHFALLVDQSLQKLVCTNTGHEDENEKSIFVSPRDSNVNTVFRFHSRRNGVHELLYWSPSQRLDVEP